MKNLILITTSFLVLLLGKASAEGLLLDGADPNQLLASRPAGRMLVLDKAGKTAVRLLPGLLDESLLSRGSFKFNSRTAHFDQLRVLGNVYANRVNGRPLRQSYLFKSALQDYSPQPAKRSEPSKRPEVAASEPNKYSNSNSKKKPENLKYLVLRLAQP